MALESASFISGLVSANPPGTDAISQGDDHLRLIKTVLKASLPNANAAINGIHTGGSAPTSTSAGQIWFDTSTNQIQMRNAGDSAWIVLHDQDGKSITNVQHTSNETGYTISGAYTLVGSAISYTKLSATSDLLIRVSTGSTIFGYDTDCSSGFRVYDNDNTSVIGIAFDGPGFEFNSGISASDNNDFRGGCSFEVIEDSPLTAGAKSIQLEAYTSDSTGAGSGNISMRVYQYAVTIMEIE